jgi:hypothetical protein
VTDWPTIASLSTAGGTLVLAVATFSSVRSSNRAARSAEESRRGSLRPLLVPSRLEEDAEKVGFADDHWVKVPGGRAVMEVTDGNIYLAMSLRNVGSGIAVLDRWFLHDGRLTPDMNHPETFGQMDHQDPSTFRRLTRDLYVPPSDRGFWQGALRDSSDPQFERTRDAINSREGLTVDLLYGDFEGGQRVISRFTIIPAHDDGWIVSASRHWNLDRSEPR